MNENFKEKLTVDISLKTIIKFFLVFFSFIFIYIIRDIVAIFLVSIIIVAAMIPLIERLNKLKIPKSVSVLAIYIILFSFIGLLISLIVPQVSLQVKEVSRDVPQFINKVNEVFGRIPQHEQIAFKIQESLRNISDNLAGWAVGAIFATFRIFGGFVTFLVILVLVFYMSVAEGEIKAFFKSISPKIYDEKFHKVIEKIQKKIGDWARGEALLMFAVGTLSFIGLEILGIKYALTLAVIAGFLEIVPLIGPLVSAIPAIIIGFVQAPILGLVVAILYIVVQQAENHILVPKVMEKTTGLSPVVVVLSILIGAKIFGILGIILAVPVAVVLSVLVNEMVLEKKIT